MVGRVAVLGLCLVTSMNNERILARFCIRLLFAAVLFVCCSCSDEHDTGKSVRRVTSSRDVGEAPPNENPSEKQTFANVDNSDSAKTRWHDHLQCISRAREKLLALLRSKLPAGGGFADPLVEQLIDAIAGDDREAIDRMILEGVDVSVENERGVTPLKWAMIVGNRWAVQRLLRSDPGLATQSDYPAVILAANYDAGLLQVILDCGVSPDVEVESRREQPRPIFAAIYTGNTASVRVLLAAEVDLNVRNRFGKTPLLEAGDGFHNYEIAYLLLAGGANPTDTCDANARLRRGITKTRAPNGEMVEVTYPVKLVSFLDVFERDRSVQVADGSIRRFSMDRLGSVSMTREGAGDILMQLPLGLHASVDVKREREWYTKVAELLRSKKLLESKSREDEQQHGEAGTGADCRN